MLLDLDELVLSCQDPRSKEYIKESVLCYKAGAYRAAVVACWIAVAFDLVDKLRELAAAGDKMAEIEISRFEKIQRENDIKGALAFEKELPELALRKFEFISYMEYEDICRLVQDRNRCAHPSHVVDSDIFTATAELARLHISNAVKYVLARPAANGKLALDRVMVDMASRYFPSRPEKVAELLSSGPLGRPRIALFRNFVIVMLKHLFGDVPEKLPKTRIMHALGALKVMHPNLWEGEFRNIFNAQVYALRTEESLNRLVNAIAYDFDVGLWDCMDAGQKERIENYLMNSPSELLDDFEVLLSGMRVAAPLRQAAEYRMARTSMEELMGVGWLLSIPVQALDRILDIYSSSRNFAEANEVGRYIRAILSSCENVKGSVRKFVVAVKKNDQVYGSNELGAVVRSFVSIVGAEVVKEEANLLGVNLEQHFST